MYAHYLPLTPCTQVGMQVLEVDDVSVCNKTLTSINAMIAGERGSVVKLKVKAINKVSGNAFPSCPH